jgi:hypothetical protein
MASPVLCPVLVQTLEKSRRPAAMPGMTEPALRQSDRGNPGLQSSPKSNAQVERDGFLQRAVRLRRKDNAHIAHPGTGRARLLMSAMLITDGGYCGPLRSGRRKWEKPRGGKGTRTNADESPPVFPAPFEGKFP